MPYQAKAPGSLILLGEYAVLYGKPALVATINRFIQVTLTPRPDNIITIDSALGQYTTTCTSLTITPPFEYVLATLASQSLTQGCDIAIKSNIPSGIGLSSSAAVTLATLQALHLWKQPKHPITKPALWKQSLSIIQHVQGQGSGADLAAGIYGGVITFQQPFNIQSLDHFPPLTAIYSGHSFKTGQAITQFNHYKANHPTQCQHFFETTHTLVKQAIETIQQKNWQTLGELINQAQSLLHTLSIIPKDLNDLVQSLQLLPEIMGAKISGAGLGDCVIGIGHTTQHPHIIPLAIINQGISSYTT